MQMERSYINPTLLVAGVFFMENLDATIISTALPRMAQSFHAAPVALNLGISVYLLTLAVFIPVSGWMADHFGARTVFTAAIVQFTVASALCGASMTLWQFVGMRFLQGVGGAMMVPVGRLIVLRVTPKERMPDAMMLISLPGLSALILGPPLGGLILHYASWRWIFYINLPIGLLALLLAFAWIENARGPQSHPFDWPTFFLGGAASAGVVYAMERLGSDAVHWRSPALIFALSILCAVVAYLLARRRPERSLIAFSELKIRSYSLAVGSASLFRIGLAGMPFLLTLMLQLSFGYSPLHAGLYLAPFFAGDMLAKLLVPSAIRRFGFRNLILAAGLLTFVTMSACATLARATPAAILFALLFVHGIFRSLEYSSILTLAFSEVSGNSLSRANSFLAAIMQLSSGMGVAVSAVALRIFSLAAGRTGPIPPLMAFHVAIALLAIFTLAPVLEARKLGREAGGEASGFRGRATAATR